VLLVMFLVYWTPLVLASMVIVMIFAHKHWVRVVFGFVAIYLLGIYLFSAIVSYYHEKDTLTTKPVTHITHLGANYV